MKECRACSRVKLLNTVYNTNDKVSRVNRFIYGIYGVLNKKNTSVITNTGERINSRIRGKKNTILDF